MPIPQNFERAQLVVDGGDPIECAFNPQEYSITKTNVWTIKPVTGTDTPKPEFGGGMPWTIRVQLLLDSSLLGDDKSIKDDAIKLLKMMESGGGGGGGSAPPFVTFKWGSIESPKMVGSSLSIRFIMFRPNGEPARALVDLELTQSEQAQQGQNPTTRAIAGLKVHTVTDGDSLQSVSYANYGDATRWRTIAEANGIDNPLALRRGTELSIPTLET
jgi:Contractile injection system tube protein/LysM domain